MNPKLSVYVRKILQQEILEDRKVILTPLIFYIQQKVEEKRPVYLHFICTHNSRRSHLAQIWSQVAASYYNIPCIQCYSGGTEVTEMFSKIVETLSDAGFEIWKLSDTRNPVYAVKFDENTLPVIGFSKRFDDIFNPINDFAAVMTCSSADEGCPFIPGAEKRFPVTFEDPKVSDGTLRQAEIYEQRSLEIASEMFYVFSQIHHT
ncbi:protein-tyrosine-phosphatase [Chryseobacterium endophyticum]|uniref:Protein-tyrosine-phosphatase n=1 Tax=Chryseobacterium endophyticum TaxID=1854762 RepID=A0AAU6WQ14_9FLAO|nr:protein-tyrosine-phosphatase [uncultured Chryseobacterium sp.]